MNDDMKSKHAVLGERVILMFSSSAMNYSQGVLMGGQSHKGQIFVRGVVEKLDAVGVTIKGIQTIKKTDTQSVREFPVDEREKIFFLPWTSVASIEVIESGSEDENINNIILERVEKLK
jgi:hypothetical protein